MAILKTTVVNGNLFVTGSDNFVSASEFRGPLTGTASFATSASEAAKAAMAMDITSSADIHVNTLQTTGNATIGGDLFVSGNLTYIGATDLRVKDKFIELNVAPEGTPTPSADGAGIKISGSTGNTGEDAAITYVAATDTIYINKPVSASMNVVVDSASFATEASQAVSASLAEQAKEVLHSLTFGSGITASAATYNGSADVTIGVDTTYLQNTKVNSASHADVANAAHKVDEKLTVSGNYISITSDYDGSTASTISLDLSNLEASASANKTAASAAQADVDALETYVGTIPTSASTVVAYAKEVAESASAAENIETKLAGVLDSASVAQTTADKAQATASANSTSIANLIASTSNYVESVVEGASTESFVTFTVTGGKYVTASIDDSALKTKIDQITGSIADVSESAAAAQATASEALNSASVITTLVNNISASQVAASSTTGLYSASNVGTALDEIATMASQSAHAAASGSEVNVIKQATAETGYAATYYVTQNGTQVGEKINIPKDFLVKSGEVKTVTTADDPYTGAVVGDKYLDFVVNAKDESETASHIYIPVKDLVDVYQGATTPEVAVTVDNNNYISASIVEVNGSKLTNGSVTKAKLADAVTASLAKADSAVQSIGTGSANGTISVDGTDVAVTGLGSAAYEDATAFDASGAADTVGTNVLASASNMSASLSAAIVNENSRSVAAETALSGRIDSMSAGMTVVETASGETHLNVAYDGTNTYAISTVNVASADTFNSYTSSANGRLDAIETATASLTTAVSGAQYTASQALTTASQALANTVENSASIAAVSNSLSASILANDDKYVNKGGDTMTGSLVMSNNADIIVNQGSTIVVKANSGNDWNLRYNSQDDALEFVFISEA